MESRKNSSLVFSTSKRKRIKAQQTIIYFNDGSNETVQGQVECHVLALRKGIRGISYVYKGRDYGLQLVQDSVNLSI